MLEKTLPQDQWTLIESGINSKVYLLDMDNSWWTYKVYTTPSGAPAVDATAIAWVEHDGYKQNSFTVNSPDTAVEVYVMPVDHIGHIVYPES